MCNFSQPTIRVFTAAKNAITSLLKHLRSEHSEETAESDVTPSQVFPYFNVSLDHIESFGTHHNHTVQGAAEKEKIKLTSYYRKTSDVCTIVVVLDPRLNVICTHVILPLM